MLTISLMGFLKFLQTAVFVVGYISNNNLFPEPLSSEEEKIYLVRMSEGDEEARKKFKVGGTCMQKICVYKR